MEIEIIEPPRKAIVNKDLRVRALREHWDEKDIRPIHRDSHRPKPMRYVQFSRSGIRFIGVAVLTGFVVPLDLRFRNCELKGAIGAGLVPPLICIYAHIPLHPVWSPYYVYTTIITTQYSLVYNRPRFVVLS